MKTCKHTFNILQCITCITYIMYYITCITYCICVDLNSADVIITIILEVLFLGVNVPVCYTQCALQVKLVWGVNIHVCIKLRQSQDHNLIKVIQDGCILPWLNIRVQANSINLVLKKTKQNNNQTTTTTTTTDKYSCSLNWCF